MQISISAKSCVFGLTFENLHIPAIQKFVHSKGISVSFDYSKAPSATITSKGGILFNGLFQQKIQELAASSSSELQKIQKYINDRITKEEIRANLQEFNRNVIKDLFSKYLDLAKPNYKEQSAYTYFDQGKDKWVSSSSSILGKLIAVYRNLFDFFSTRQSKVRLANQILQLEDQEKIFSSAKVGEKLDTDPSTGPIEILEKAVAKNNNLDSKGGRLALLLKYSLVAHGKITLVTEEQTALTENILHQLSL